MTEDSLNCKLEKLSNKMGIAIREEYNSKINFLYILFFLIIFLLIINFIFNLFIFYSINSNFSRENIKMIKKRENRGLAKFSGTFNDFNGRVDGNDVLLEFENVHTSSIVVVSIGSLMFSEDVDFVLEENYIRLYNMGDEYNGDYTAVIMVFKDSDTSGDL